MIASLATERALIACVLAAAIGRLLTFYALALHGASQPLGRLSAYVPQRGTWWASLATLARAVMWCSLAAGALSLALNVIRYARVA